MLKTTQKQSLSSALQNVPFFHPCYQNMKVLERGLKILLAGNSDSSCLGLFQLFSAKTNQALIFIHINLDPATNQAPYLNKQNQKSRHENPEYMKKEVKGKEQFELRVENVDKKKQRTSRS